MTAKVTEDGLLIPRELLNGFEEVEIRRENDRVIIIGAATRDPIWSLGSAPVATEESDASVNHDAYLTTP